VIRFDRGPLPFNAAYDVASATGTNNASVDMYLLINLKDTAVAPVRLNDTALAFVAPTNRVEFGGTGQRVSLAALNGRAVWATLGPGTNARTLAVQMGPTSGEVTLGVPPALGNTVAYILGPCGASDIAGEGGSAIPDGNLDNNDFIVFINRFFDTNPAADVGVEGGASGSDGLFDNNDFIVFIQNFFAGC
jgi:hypothetical protein